jgi:hypothetical protein
VGEWLSGSPRVYNTIPKHNILIHTCSL